MKAIFIFFSVSLMMNGDLQFDNSSPASDHFLKQPISKNIVWAESLSQFRKAVLDGDMKTVKHFFVFPILNPGNDIWIVADMENVTRMTEDKIVPFKESDFDKHYNDILTNDFKQTFEKLDISKLSKEKKAESPALKIVSPATSQMKALYSDSKKTITLSLVTKSPEFGQYSIDYHFKILPSGAIRFAQVQFNM